jgi:hypothetical protein
MRLQLFLPALLLCLTPFFKAEAQKKKTFKGSRDYDVIHYTISIEDINFTTKILTANTNLRFTPKLNNTSAIQLDLLKLTIDSMLYNNSRLQTFTYNDTVISITLPQAINTTDTVNLKIFYHGNPKLEPYQWGGFHIDGTYAYNLGVAFQAYPHNFGKGWFPCLDNFTDRATYDYYVKVKGSHKAICGGTLLSVTPGGGNTKIYHWKMNSNIPTYLASVAVGDYAAIHDTFNGINGKIPIGIYVRPSDSLRAINSFTNLKNILGIIEGYWGPYKWERVGYVGTDKGAMEHACNIAYPNSCITGNSTYEWLYAHEVSHQWFGDLVTCSTQEDMWINEGWATYCESLYREGLYGAQSYKTSMHTRMKDVLYSTHFEDGGFYPLSGIPETLTYGSTVYDKGAVVVHTLRNYLGDARFFSTVKSFLNAYAFKDVSSITMRDYFSAHTGIDMTDFFNAWVFTPGFPHFSVDSFAVTNISQPIKDVKVYVRQKHLANNSYANSNKAELTFIGANWQKFTDTIRFSGQTGNATFHMNFVPVAVILDLEEKIADATIDNYQTIKTIGVKSFPDTYFSFDVSQINDSAFMRVEHSLVEPDPLKTPIQGLVVSKEHYWKIDGIFPAGFIGKGKFNYSKGGLDKGLIKNTADSLFILYRPTTKYDWQFIHYTRTGGGASGYISVDSIRKGEYTFAIWDWDYGIKEQKNGFKKSLNIYPNPSNDSFIINFNAEIKGLIRIINSSGTEVVKFKIVPLQTQIKWQPGSLQNGIYIVELLNENYNIVERSKIIYTR